MQLAQLALTLPLGGGLSANATATPESVATRPRVVVTTTIIADVVRNVGGDAVEVTVLMPVGADPHDFHASARQVAELLRADLVVANGASLEEGLADMLASAANDGANVLQLAALLPPIESGGPTAEDPHIWLDPQRMAGAAQLIADALGRSHPRGNWDTRARGFVDRLHAADQQILSILATIPAAKRKLITNHDALGYFAHRYGFEILATIIPGRSSLGAPSSRQLARLVELLQDAEVRAIFVETTQPDSLARALAAEVGADVSVVELYTGSLGAPGSGAETLIGMLQTNAGRIAQALR